MTDLLVYLREVMQMTATERLIETVKVSKWICRRRPQETEAAVLSLLRGWAKPYNKTNLERAIHLNKSEVCREKGYGGILFTIMFEVIIGVIVALIVRWIVKSQAEVGVLREALKEQGKTL